MKTIAISDRTFEVLKRLKEKKNVKTFENLVIDLIIEGERIPSNLFGSLKGKTKSFTSKERENIWKER